MMNMKPLRVDLLLNYLNFGLNYFWFDQMEAINACTVQEKLLIYFLVFNEQENSSSQNLDRPTTNPLWVASYWTWEIGRSLILCRIEFDRGSSFLNFKTRRAEAKPCQKVPNFEATFKYSYLRLGASFLGASKA